MQDRAHPAPPVPLPDLAVWRHIAIGGVDLGHLPQGAAELVRSRAWDALRADRARRTGTDPDAITPGATGTVVLMAHHRRRASRMTILPPTGPGDAA